MAVLRDELEVHAMARGEDEEKLERLFRGSALEVSG